MGKSTVALDLTLYQFLLLKKVLNKKAFQQNAYCALALTVHASIATKCQHRGCEVNRFEEVSSGSDGY